MAVFVRRFDRRLVRGADIAAVSDQRPIGVDGDDGPGNSDFGWLVTHGPVVERLDRGFDLAQPLIDLVWQFVGVIVLLGQAIQFRLQGHAGRLLFVGYLDRRAGKLAHPMGGAVRNAEARLDPFPALGGDLVGFCPELLGDQSIKQADVLEPPAIVGLEKIAQHDAAGGFIGVDTDEDRAFVGGADRGFGQHPPDLPGLFLPAIADRRPDLFLAGVVLGDGEGHDVFERHAVLGIDIEQDGRHGGEAQALLDDVRAHEKGGGDGLLGHTLLAHRVKRTELVERVQRRPFDVFNQGDFIDQDAARRVADNAGHRGSLGQALLFGEEFERTIAAPASGYFEHAGFQTLRVVDGADMKRLDQAAPRDGFGEFLDGDAGLHSPDVRLAEHELVEWDVARRRQGDLLNGSCHGSYSMTGCPKASLSDLNPSRSEAPPSSSEGAAPQ